MDTIWHPPTLIEGQLARMRLQDEGIACHLAGEHLSGGLGELPAFGLYALMVDRQQVAQALALLREWGLVEDGTGSDIEA